MDWTIWIPDLIIAAVLLVFVFLGAKRGLILTLCSMAALIVAFIGASLAADLLAPVVAPKLEPMIAQVLESQLQAEAQGQAPTSLSGIGGFSSFWASFEGTEWGDTILTAIRDGMSDVIAGTARGIAVTTASAVAYIGLFLIFFVLISIAWFFLSRALDLAFRLPVLSTFNTAGGLLIGLLKGVLLCFFLGLALRRFPGLIDADVVERTTLLRFFLQTNPLDLISARGV